MRPFKKEWPKILGSDRAKKAESVAKALPRGSGTWREWYEACRGGEPAGCNFQWADFLTHFVLLGNIAIRTQRILHWDAEKSAFTNCPEANAQLSSSYRDGWSLQG